MDVPAQIEWPDRENYRSSLCLAVWAAEIAALPDTQHMNSMFTVGRSPLTVVKQLLSSDLSHFANPSPVDQFADKTVYVGTNIGC